MVYDFKKIESKWQKKWEQKKIFEVKEDSKKKKYYVLEMYPYPSGSGLHMGHAFNYIIGDILARYKRMQGYNVLHPMGFDSFGLPAENAAIKEKAHPKKFTDEAIKNYIRQLKMLGISYDWNRMLMSHDVNYYKWNQWIFLQMYKKGLAYRKKSPVNFCIKCNTVLANEQVHNGKCWRHEDTEVEIKNLEQWFLKITDYAEELLEDIEKLDWPERIKIMQRNWIGKSEGTEINFEINGLNWKIFTTRPDTIYGVTFMVVSAQHLDLMNIVTEEQKKEVEIFLRKIKTTKQEDLDKLEKEGVFTGSYALHPLTKEKIPVWIGNFVLAEYGSGMVMGVPAHDSRDFEFAKKYNFQIKEVVSGGDTEKGPYMGAGKLINSDEFNGLSSREAKEHIINALKDKKLGKKTVQYKLRDWLVSRQRYWGTPIPILYDENGNIVPVSENSLPVKLPNKVKFGKGNPLENSRSFIKTKVKNKFYRRETDTMDTFFDSSWYFLRFIDPKNKKKLFDFKKIDYWMPVDFYTGGAEHACMHLIYARFFIKFLRDLGLINKKINEPFSRLFNQGMLHKGGYVMSKSRGNIVLPEEVSKKYGIDTARLFLMSSASPDKDKEWTDEGIEGSLKFVKKLFEFFSVVKIGKSNKRVESKVNKGIKEISEDIENLKYNLAIIKLKILFDYIFGKEISKSDLESCIKLLSPFCPHVAEELWEKIKGKNFISLAEWPRYDEEKINEKFEKEEELVEELVNDINHVKKIIDVNSPKYTIIYSIPNEKNLFEENTDFIKNSTASGAVIIYSTREVTLNPVIDPEGKAKKAKPGKPGIYVSGTDLPWF